MADIKFEFKSREQAEFLVLKLAQEIDPGAIIIPPWRNLQSNVVIKLSNGERVLAPDKKFSLPTFVASVIRHMHRCPHPETVTYKFGTFCVHCGTMTEIASQFLAVSPVSLEPGAQTLIHTVDHDEAGDTNG